MCLRACCEGVTQQEKPELKVDTAPTHNFSSYIAESKLMILNVLKSENCSINKGIFIAQQKRSSVEEQQC